MWRYSRRYRFASALTRYVFRRFFGLVDEVSARFVCSFISYVFARFRRIFGSIFGSIFGDFFGHDFWTRVFLYVLVSAFLFGVLFQPIFRQFFFELV